ncbi:hypothetical protein BN1088_1431050 [Sphingobacterium sp. PM2-P1-29]|nr:hypothetical protein BN1088_1431050 [Sphingobacterium sp. PM2-P1-29]
MAISIIQRYLSASHKNYDEGRVLFERYSDNKVLIALFRSGNSSYHCNRLYVELAKLKEEDPVLVPEKLKVEKPVIPTLESFDRPSKAIIKDDFHTLPDQIKDVYRKKNMHYSRYLQLFIEIGMTDDKDARLEMALTMLSDKEEVNACWAVIDAYKETGQILLEETKTIQEEVNELPLDQLIALIKNIPPNISKDKGKLKMMPDGHRKAKVLLRYERNKIKLDLVKTRLEAMNNV